VAIVLLVPAGFAWLATFSTLNALVQLSTPAYLKSRSLALYQLSFYATWSIGSLVGGAFANRVGAPVTLAVAAVGTLFAAALCARLPVPSFGGDTAHDVLSTPAPVSVR
jgi:hypothetical protein